MSEKRRDYEEVHQLVEWIDPPDPNNDYEGGKMWWKGGSISGYPQGGGRWFINLHGKRTHVEIPRIKGHYNELDKMYVMKNGEAVQPFTLKDDAFWRLLDLFYRRASNDTT